MLLKHYVYKLMLKVTKKLLKVTHTSYHELQLSGGNALLWNLSKTVFT